MINKVIRRVEKNLNQRRSYDYNPAAGEFEKYSNNPVLSGVDGGSMFDPFVRKTGDEYLMLVSNRKEKSLEFYTSVNGIDWKLKNQAVKGIADTWEENINRGTFLYKDGLMYLFYTGQKDGKSCIGLAKSSDGRNFERVGDNPIVTPELDFETAAVMNPCVIYDDEKKTFRMWYAAGENFEPDVISYAESEDGISWEKHGVVMAADKTKEYQKAKVGACDIARLDDGRYCMAYIAYQNVDVARICLAYSENGIDNWVYDKDNPILSPEKGKWDSSAVYKPTFVFEKDRKLIWYNGRRNEKESIGFALKDKK